MCGMGSDFSAEMHERLESDHASTRFWTMAPAICGSRPAKGLRAAIAERCGRWTECSHWMEFGAADGLRSRETATNSHPSAWRSRDGHLWFATPKGLVEVDPAHFPVNAVPPPVALERFTVDDVAQPLRAAGLSVASSGRSCPLRIRLRGAELYRAAKGALSLHARGLRPWLDRGRRAAHRLLHQHSAGQLHVSRAGGQQRRALEHRRARRCSLNLRPHFYQTIWFYALLLLAWPRGIVLLLRMRLRRAEREFNAVLGERSRIAREIHDTLAQGYVGISVQLEVLGGVAAAATR